MSLESIFILNKIGDVLIEKHYRGHISRNLAEIFWGEVMKNTKPEDTLPIITTDKHYLIHIQHSDLFILAIVGGEQPPLMIIDFLYTIIETFKDYFQIVDSENLKKHFVTVYQLLDEMADNGIPFTTEPMMLKEMIKPPSLLNDFMNTVLGPEKNVELPTMGTIDGAKTGWRKNGIKHSNNEFFLDIIEEVDAILDEQGNVVSAEVSGEVQSNCLLSGMPDLTLIYKNSRVLDDCSFHPCVRLKRWEVERVVSFVPPDGKFKLMSYRVQQGVSLPLYVKPQIHFNKDGGSVSLMVGRKHSDKNIEKISLTIPFSRSLGSSKIELTANYGKVKYDDSLKICRWEIDQLPKDKSPILEGKVSLAYGIPPPESNPVVIVDFEIQSWSASGISVDSLLLKGEDYKPYKGVKLITRSGTFQVRT
eukprot:TRINITY_DN4876_c0_g4_i1.p1 TRINITY_DN4876_c0_g4~~TRINITY_DN4876_c0_g4_i1.p1  ORF type:complete len:419 (+),score=106.41 TRINITY_DN4876_c0_g4_i1:45-1301(+)